MVITKVLWNATKVETRRVWGFSSWMKVVWRCLDGRPHGWMKVGTWRREGGRNSMDKGHFRSWVVRGDGVRFETAFSKRDCFRWWFRLLEERWSFGRVEKEFFMKVWRVGLHLILCKFVFTKLFLHLVEYWFVLVSRRDSYIWAFRTDVRISSIYFWNNETHHPEMLRLMKKAILFAGFLLLK